MARPPWVKPWPTRRAPPLKKWKSFRKKTALVSSSAIKLPFGFLICMCEPGDPAWAEGGAQPFLTSKRTPMRVDSEKQLVEIGHRLWKKSILCCAKNTLHGKLICRRVIVSLSGKYTHALLFLISGLYTSCVKIINTTLLSSLLS